MKSIKESTEFSLRERGSKFFGFLFYTSTISEFDLQLQELRNRYPDATHHCSAYRIFDGSIAEYNSDDGEPSGSAGLPILNALRSAELVNVAAVVVRYYGGTKLGKTGLIEAYGETIRGCIQKAAVGKIEKFAKINVCYNYANEKDIQQIIRLNQLIEEASTYQQEIEKLVLCPIEFEEGVITALQKLEYKNITFKHLGHTFVMK